MKKKISLVLGSGGARGLAHIGIINWLEEHNYEIIAISGCSMGSLVGGFFAAGKLDELTTWALSLDTYDLLKLLDFKGTGGLVSGETLFEKIEEILGDPNIEDLKVEFTAVASDINEEKEVWITKGSLIKAIRASVSLPLFFTPFKYKNRLLIDGGVLNPVPIAPTFDDDSELTIAVNLGGESDPALDVKDIVVKEESSFSSTIREFFGEINLPESIATKYTMYQIADKSFDSMQGTIARMKLAAYPPDIEITLPRNICGTLEFNRAKEMIDYGYNKCDEIFTKENLDTDYDI